MADIQWRTLERAWLSDPEDQRLLRTAIAARERAGEPTPPLMLEALRTPRVAFATQEPLTVRALLEDGSTKRVGKTPRKKPLVIPRSRVWWIEVETPAGASEQEVRQTVRDAGLTAVEHEVPGVSLSGAAFLDGMLEPLADSPHLEWLRVEKAYLGKLTAKVLSTLWALRWLALPSTVVSQHDFEWREVFEVVGSRPRLLELTVGNLQLRDKVLQLPSCLRRLVVRGKEWEIHLGEAPGLVSVDLAGAFKSLPPRLLSDLTSLSELRELDLSDLRISDAQAPSLTNLTGLRALGVGATSRVPGLSDEGLDHLRALTELEGLNLDYAEVSGGAIARLVGHCPRLERLSLRSCRLVDDGALQALATLPGLRDLQLDYCVQISEAGLAALASAPALERITFNTNKTHLRATAAARTALREARPDLKLVPPRAWPTGT